MSLPSTATSFLVAMALLIIGWIIGIKIIFPIKKEDRKPSIPGGMGSLKKDLKELGDITFYEVKSIIIFVSILALWVTDKWHGISPTAVAFVGAIVALMPKISIIKWNDVDIPWHLLLFSAGAYTLGASWF